VSLINPRMVEKDHMGTGRFSLLYNIGYKLDQKYFSLFVEVLHTKIEHHNVCMNVLVPQGLTVER
jgi:hypothetical protein